MEKSHAAKRLKFCYLWNNLFFRRTPECLLEDFDTVDFIMLLIHPALNAGTEELGGWWVAQDWSWGQPQKGICPNLPLLSIRENDDTQRLCLPCTSHVHPCGPIKCTSKLVWNGGPHAISLLPANGNNLLTGQVLVKPSFSIQPWSHWANTAVIQAHYRTLL